MGYEQEKRCMGGRAGQGADKSVGQAMGDGQTASIRQYAGTGQDANTGRAAKNGRAAKKGRAAKNGRAGTDGTLTTDGQPKDAHPETRPPRAIRVWARTWALLRALPRALREYGRERRGRLRLLAMDDRLLHDLGFTREQAEQAVARVRFRPIWTRLAQGAPRKSSCRKHCPTPPTVMEQGCCGQG